MLKLSHPTHLFKDAELGATKRENVIIKKTNETTNQYAIASKIESGVSLARAHITQPIQVHPPPFLRMAQRETIIERESLKAIERVIIRTAGEVEEEEARKPAEYVVINKVIPIVDTAEMMTVQLQESTTSDDRSSTSPSITDDTLSHLNLDAFEPVGPDHHHREIVRFPVKVIFII